MRYAARAALVVATVEVVQVALLERVSVFGAHPDAMILLPAAAGYLAGPGAGALMGFSAGIVADLFQPTPFGLTALVWTFLGYAIGSLVLQVRDAEEGAAGPAGTLPVALVGCLATLTGMAAFSVLGAIFGVPEMLTWYLPNALPVAFLSSLLLAGPVFAAVRWTLVSGASGGPGRGRLGTTTRRSTVRWS